MHSELTKKNSKGFTDDRVGTITLAMLSQHLCKQKPIFCKGSCGYLKSCFGSKAKGEI